jgi:hypothetical protein
MVEKKIRTGIEQLDEDLIGLFELCDDNNRLDAVKNAIANKDITTEEFAKIVPESIVRLSVALNGPQYNLFLLEKIREDSISLVEQAKNLLDKHFPNLFENKAAKSTLKKEMAEPPESEESLADKVISGVGYYCKWDGAPPKLTPAIHISFKNKKRKILLDSVLEWDDLSFVVETLTGAFVDLLEKGKALVELGQLDLSEAAKVGERIGRTFEDLEKVKKLAHSYKVKIVPPEKKTEGEGKD